VAAGDALARAIADGSGDRLRTCVGDPCRCVYVDRTKANRQRYCCELCNDRMASAAYRRRNR
jgi:predicted RNA-binding Zn ribbon-like protein